MPLHPAEVQKFQNDSTTDASNMDISSHSYCNSPLIPVTGDRSTLSGPSLNWRQQLAQIKIVVPSAKCSLYIYTRGLVLWALPSPLNRELFPCAEFSTQPQLIWHLVRVSCECFSGLIESGQFSCQLLFHFFHCLLKIGLHQ